MATMTNILGINASHGDASVALCFNQHLPIVATPSDAVACYSKTKMNVLALGNWVLSRP
jgi:predicted NodU family carbamoyl transferase